MLAESLEKIVANTPGAIGAILMGFDGIAVMDHTVEDAEIDIEHVAMEFSFRFVELRKAAQALDMGDVSDITIKTDTQAVLCRVLSEEYFVLVLLGDSAHLGKGRYVLRTASADLSTEL